MANYGSSGTIVMVVNRHFLVTSALRFAIADLPKPGAVRVVSPSGGSEELRHIAPDMAAAQAWRAEHHYRDARFEIVGDDGLTQGRAA